jgi:thiamine phosphate synthase YjbQ (UPF0047 family)
VTSHTVYKTFNTVERREFVRITDDVQGAVDESGVSEGMVLAASGDEGAGIFLVSPDAGAKPGMRVK